MTTPSVEPQRKPKRTLRQRWREWITPGKWVVIATTANVISTGIFVFASVSAGEEARRHNCAATVEAFDGYTDALAQAFGVDPRDPEVDAFRANYQPVIEKCR